MTRTSLRFVHADRPPVTDGIRVFDSQILSFLGTEFTFRIIGSSHYISAPAYGFHELSTCDPDPIADREGTVIPLEPDRPVRHLTFESARLRCETTVDHRPLAAFPHDRFRSRPDSFDLAYAFDGDPDAVTTIEIGEDGYETYHTYPEFDLALYTRTVFTDVRDDGSPATTRDTDRARKPRTSDTRTVF